ncbi:MAG: hypothetical protein RLZZ271_637 [Pseudomonadota bacterium]
MKQVVRVKHELRDVCELINGRAYSKDELLTEGKYPVLRVGNFFTNNNWYHSDLELPAEKYCKAGDLLYAWSASFGPRIWSGPKVIFHYHIWKVIPNPALIDQRYLFYFFIWDTDRIKQDQGAGTTMIHVAKGSMEAREIALPPLPEQRRIVAILDEAFEAIATAKENAERNLRGAREVWSKQLDIFFENKDSSWKETTVENILLDQPRNGWSPPAANHSDSGTPVLTLSSVTGFVFREEKIKFTSAETNPNAHYWVKNGDLLLTRSNTPTLVGHVAVAEGLIEPTIYPDLIMRMTPDPILVECKFLYYQLRTSYLREIITSRAQGANPTMVKLNKSSVQSLPISVPSLDVQRQIVDELENLAYQTQTLATIYDQKISALDELKKSLLHQAFSGQL